MQNPKSLSNVTRELLAAYNLYPKKRLGQNFLIDPKVLERIVGACQLSSNDFVIEIGMGLGVLTEALVKKVASVISIEVDSDMVMICREILKQYQNLDIVRGSILDWELPEHFGEFKVVGNLPYYITSAIIQKVLSDWKGKVRRGVFTIQKEVAERILADPGGKEYGSFSIFVQNHAKVGLNSLISKFSFYPQPEVSSAIIVLEPYKKPLYKIDHDLVRLAFSQRRKMLRSTLAHLNIDWEKIGIDPTRRPETISLEEFEAISLSSPLSLS